MTMTVEPIYGNGWTDGQDEVPEPSPFTVDALRRQDGTIAGHIVTSEDATLVGARFEATPRHLTSDAIYNCHIKMDGGVTLSGYCKIT